MPTATAIAASAPAAGTGQAVTALALLETSTDPGFACFLGRSAAPVEGIELPPEFFYNWTNWGNK